MNIKNDMSKDDKLAIGYIREQLKHEELDITAWGTQSEESEKRNKHALELIEKLINDYEKSFDSTSDKELVLNMGDTSDEQKLDEIFANKINKECHANDPEYDHDNADGILCELLEGLGFSKTVEAFGEVEKYYA